MGERLVQGFGFRAWCLIGGRKRTDRQIYGYSFLTSPKIRSEELRSLYANHTHKHQTGLKNIIDFCPLAGVLFPHHSSLLFHTFSLPSLFPSSWYHRKRYPILSTINHANNTHLTTRSPSASTMQKRPMYAALSVFCNPTQTTTRK